MMCLNGDRGVPIPFIYTKNTKQVEVANYKCNESYQHCFDLAIDRRPDRFVIISWNNERIMHFCIMRLT